MPSKTEIEEVEEKILRESTQYIVPKIEENFIGQTDKITNEELVNNLSAQGDGRASWPEYSIEYLSKQYPNLDQEESSELGKRLASLNIFSDGLERTVAMLFYEYLDEHNYDFKPWISPDAADSVFLVKDFYKNINVMLHIDAKSLSGFKNLNDAKKEGVIGKHQVKWNQTSYREPRLRNKINGQDSYQKKKYKVLDNIQEVGEDDYLTVTLFMCNLMYVSQDDKKSLKNGELSGEDLSNITYLGCVPNGLLESDYYDSFFQSGKNGYDDDSGVPKDTRFFYIKNSIPLKFENLQEGTRVNLLYPRPDSNEETINLVYGDNNGEVREGEVKVQDF